MLAVAAFAGLGHLAILGTSLEDAEALESPLALAAARQLTSSPRELHGPFGRQNPYVLIHAPLYYRVTGVIAGLLVRTGLDPVRSAIVAGRSISFLGFLGTLLAAYRLARLEGRANRVGWWAVCLIASAPVVVSMPVAVRPDMLGVWFQTTAALLVLSAIIGDQPGRGRVAAALALFALAICVKQHFVASAVVCIPILFVRSRRGAIRRGVVERGLVLAAAIVLVYYGAEEVISGGRMSAAILTAAASVGVVHPTSWHSASIVYFAFLGRSLGFLTLLVGLGLAWVDREGWSRRGLSLIVGLLTGATLAVSFSQLFLATFGQVVFLVFGILTIVLLALPLCAIIERRFLAEGRVDTILLCLIASEIAVAMLLCRASTGAWINYGIPVIVYLSVLVARALDRAIDAAETRRRFGWIAGAAIAPLLGAVAIGQYNLSQREIDRGLRAIVLAKMARPAGEFFFVDRPGMNRLDGRLDLVYDDWLYPVFERSGLAEPRAAWLRAKLTDGTVTVVVNTHDGPGIPGIVPSLARLGFVKRFSIEPVVYIWERSAFARGPGTR